MKKSIHLSKLIFILLLSIPCNTFAQSIDWIYEVQAKEKTIPRFFWVDGEGNGYYNVNLVNPVKPGDGNYGSMLVMLDGNGKYRRTTKINNCNGNVKLLPFARNKLLASGHFCGKTYNEKDTRLFNFKGETLKTEPNAFPGNHFSNVPTEEGFTFFSKPTAKWGYTFVSIGKIDKQLKISAEEVPLAPIAKKDLGIVNSFRDPAIFTNGTWAIPFQYGKVKLNGGGIRPQYGVVIGTKDSEIIWEYPKEQAFGPIESISSYQDQVAVLIDQPGSSYLFAMLDENGVEREKFNLNASSRIIRDLLVTDKYIIVVGLSTIHFFNKTGELIKDINLKDLEITGANRAQLLNENSMICTARQDGNAVVIKIKFDETEKFEEEFVKVNTEEEQPDTEISYGSIDNDMDAIVISATVYPNPTSSFINFEIDRSLENQGSIEIQIFDASGKLLISRAFENSTAQMDVQDFPAGTYIYRIITKNQSSLLTGQFIKVNR